MTQPFADSSTWRRFQWLPTHRNVDGRTLTSLSLFIFAERQDRAFGRSLLFINGHLEMFPKTFLTAIIGVMLMVARVQSIMWYLEPSTQKCLKEEVQANVIINGEYEISDVPGQKVDYTVITLRRGRLLRAFRLCPLTFNMDCRFLQFFPQYFLPYFSSVLFFRFTFLTCSKLQSQHAILNLTLSFVKSTLGKTASSLLYIHFKKESFASRLCIIRHSFSYTSYNQHLRLSPLKAHCLFSLILQVKDSNGHVLAQKEDIQHGSHRFSFSTETYDTFEICFVSHVPARMYFNRIKDIDFLIYIASTF